MIQSGESLAMFPPRRTQRRRTAQSQRSRKNKRRRFGLSPKRGVWGEKFPLPKEAQAEEFYLTKASNELAKQGWEALNIDSRRILFRRPVSK